MAARSSAITSAGGAEPSGPTQLTIVNGVNDYDAIRICFLPYPAGDPAALPWPSEAAGLPFARAVVVKPIDTAIPANQDVRPHIIAGDLTRIIGYYTKLWGAKRVAVIGTGASAAQLAPAIAGKVKAVLAGPGDAVKAGQVLVEFE